MKEIKEQTVFEVACSQYDGFKIYGDGKVLFERNRELEKGELTKNGWLVTSRPNSKILTLLLEQEPKRAVKLNLNRTDNFYIKEKNENSYFNSTMTVLYIHVSEFESVETKEYLWHLSNDDEKKYMNACDCVFKHGYLKNDTIIREVPLDYQPVDTKEAQSLFYKKNIVDGTFVDDTEHLFLRYTEIVTHKEAVLPSDGVIRTEKSNALLEKESLLNNINEKIGRRVLGMYELEKILIHYDITKK